MKTLHIIAIVIGIAVVILSLITKDWSVLGWACAATIWPVSSLAWYCRYLEEKYKNKRENN